MNIVNKLTLRHLRQNKKRTLVTFIGVVISVAMITAVATLGVSFLDFMQRMTIAESGEWHVQYDNVTKEQLRAIQADEQTKAVILTRERGFALFEQSSDINKPYLYIQEFNQAGFDHYPIHLIEGRFPQAKNEIVVSEEAAKRAVTGLNIGDTLSLQVGQRTVMSEDGNEIHLSQYSFLEISNTGEIIEALKYTSDEVYTIVGIMKRPNWEEHWSPAFTTIAYVDDNILTEWETIDAQVVLHHVDRSHYDHTSKLAKENKIESIRFNDNLLRYYGAVTFDKFYITLLSVLSVIIGVIVIGSISLIYNAFAISVSDRTRHYGMLASVGATKRQKRNSVLFEGVVIGFISIPVGLICGIVGIGSTLFISNSFIKGVYEHDVSLRLVVTPLSIIIACVISFITIVLSAYIPAKKASKISAIDAIRQVQDIKLTKKAVKTSRITRVLFGFEAAIGLKNLKRNKRKYRATLFSLIVSIVLFLSVTYFADSFQSAVRLTQTGVNYDIRVGTMNRATDYDRQVFHTMGGLEGVDEYNISTELQGIKAYVKIDQIAKSLREEIMANGTIPENGQYPLGVYVHAFDEQYLQSFAKEIGADVEQLTDPDRITAIVQDVTHHMDHTNETFIETNVLETNVGESLHLHYVDLYSEATTVLDEVEIVALTNQLPLGARHSGLSGINLFMSEQSLQKLLGNYSDLQMYTYLYLKTADPENTQLGIDQIVSSNMYVNNLYDNRQKEERMMFIIRLFAYGFIALISAISVANIVNTIATSIGLRKREFAMLRSVGMTPKGFNKMINYESIFYGLKAILYGLPISLLIMLLIHKTMKNTFDIPFLIPWSSIGIVIVAVYIIVGVTMLYASAKVKKENIIDALKSENI